MASTSLQNKTSRGFTNTNRDGLAKKIVLKMKKKINVLYVEPKSKLLQFTFYKL